MDGLRRLFKKIFNRGKVVNNQGKSLTLLTISRLKKLRTYFVMLPANLNIEEHLVNFSPQDYGFSSKLKFDIEKAKLILGLLTSIPAQNKDLIVEDGYIPINAEILNGFITDYSSYLKYLISTGVIETDGISYDGRSRRYRYASTYFHSEKTRVNMAHFERLNEAKRTQFIDDLYQGEEVNIIEDCSYLSHWYEQKKQSIDIQKASQYARLITSKRLEAGEESWDWNKDKDERKNPQAQLDAFMYNLESLTDYSYKVKIDNNVHRQHSVLTNMQKDYRNFITYDGQELVSIDISNSQPYLACLLFNPEFWKENSSLPLNLKSLPNNIQSLFIPNTTTSIPITLGKKLRDYGTEPFNEYLEIVQSGKMYEIIAEWIRQERSISIDEKIVKTQLFKIMYSSNYVSEERKVDELYWLEQYYKRKFPTVMEVFKIIKRTFKNIGVEKQYARLAILLQSIESEIILHRCCKRIWEEGNQQMPIFTIHDSIVTTKENVEFVEKIMQEELTQCIGIPPKFKREEWKESNLEHQDILAQINEQKSE